MASEVTADRYIHYNVKKKLSFFYCGYSSNLQVNLYARSFELRDEMPWNHRCLPYILPATSGALASQHAASMRAHALVLVKRRHA